MEKSSTIINIKKKENAWRRKETIYGWFLINQRSWEETWSIHETIERRKIKKISTIFTRTCWKGEEN